MEKPKNIDEYIAGFDPEVQEILKKIRSVVKSAAPDATEKIAYGVPTFVQNGNLVHFGAYKEHIGFFPTPEGMQTFAKELLPYSQSKGTARFPYDKPIPYDLIKRITLHRVKVNSK